MSFEQDYNRLQEIVKKLEEGDLPLKESLELFQEGISLYRRCQEELSQAEGKILELIKSVDQEWEVIPFKREFGGSEPE